MGYLRGLLRPSEGGQHKISPRESRDLIAWGNVTKEHFEKINSESCDTGFLVRDKEKMRNVWRKHGSLERSLLRGLGVTSCATLLLRGIFSG
jgi:hypothetical protein